MKALEILNNLINDTYDDYGLTLAEIIEMKEAIAELEALQHIRCNYCVFYYHPTGVCGNDKCPLWAETVESTFGCIHFKPEEQR